MKVKVTKKDIKEGREYVNDTCGCSVHRALVRALKVGDGDVIIPHVTEAVILGKLKLALPSEAVGFQITLMEDEMAEVEPFEFEITEVL